MRTIITIPVDDKKWLDNHSRRKGLSSAEIVRRAIAEYRRRASRGGFRRVLRETAGKWKSLKGDSQEHVNALRSDWEQRD